MNAKEKERLIREQQNYLDFVCAEQPYRRVTVADRANARAELAQLHAKSAMLEVLDGDDGLSAINRIMAACERDDIAQKFAPDIQAVQAEIVAVHERIAELESAVNEARTVISQAEDFVSSINGYDNGMTATLSRAWLTAHP